MMKPKSEKRTKNQVIATIAIGIVASSLAIFRWVYFGIENTKYGIPFKIATLVMLWLTFKEVIRLLEKDYKK